MLFPVEADRGIQGETGKQRPWRHLKVSSKTTSRKRNTKGKGRRTGIRNQEPQTQERENGSMAGVVERSTDDAGEL